MNPQSQFSWCRFILLTACLTVAASVANGQQTAARPDRGTMPGASYSISDFESVSLTNGNVHVSIPLASLPPIAGGQLKFTLSAVYDSKLWDVTRAENQLPPLGGCGQWVVNTPQRSEQGGWRVDGTYTIVMRNANEDFAYVVPDPPPATGCESDNAEVTRLQSSYYKTILITPDGAEHELRPVDTNAYYGINGGTRSYLYNYYKDTPDSTNAPMRYYSFDGSFLYAVINPSSYSTRWTIYLNDGTKVSMSSGGIRRITDTNGNSIKIFSDSNGAHYQDELTGREIRYTYDPAANGGNGQGQVHYQTVTGTEETTYINFGTTAVQGKVYRVDDWSSGVACFHDQSLNTVNLQVIRSIVFPVTESGVAARQFSFAYNSDATTSATDTVVWGCGQSSTSYPRTVSQGMGELSQVTTPTGAVVNYSYSNSATNRFLDADDLARTTITQKDLHHDSVTETWTYEIDGLLHTTGKVTGPDGAQTVDTAYSTDSGAAMFGRSAKSGLTYRSNQANKVLIERHWTMLTFSGANTGPAGANSGTVTFNPVVDAEYTSLLDDTTNHNPIKMSARTYQYDYNGNLISQTDYDWFDPSLVTRDTAGVPTGVPGGAVPLRSITNLYHNPASESTSGNVYAKRALSTATPLILSALQQATSGPSIAQFFYDGNAYNVAPTIGNVTSRKVWDDVDNKWITTSSTYDSYGNVLTATDGRQKVTTITYDPLTHAQPVSVMVDPQNNTGTQTSYTTYDSSTGLVTSTTDVNNQVSTISYLNPRLGGAVDPFGRPGTVTGPAVTVNGNPQHQHMTTTYYDDARQVMVATDLFAPNDQLLKTRTTSDMLGRPILSEQTEDGTNYTIASYQVYDTVNRITYSSSPRRSSSFLTDSWTRVTSDVLGRPTEVATFGGASQPPATGTTSVPGFSGKVSTVYEANFTTVTDQAGRVRRSMSDGLGRLIRIDEPDKDSGQLGSNTDPLQPTCYDYDILGNLTKVVQGTQLDSATGRCALSGSQQRTFTYDTVSRLRSAVNPESGTVTYGYDDNGNLTSKTDARPVTTSYVYDSLNRVTSRSYSDGTPTVTYAYDTATNGKGRLASVISAVSRYDYSGYDETGKVQGGTQTIYGQTNQPYPFGYVYDLSGHVTQMSYPSGHVVNYNYDNAGRLADRDANNLAFTGTLGDNSPRTYARGLSYAPGGQMIQERLGTTTAIYNKLFYNSRGQLAEIREGLTANNDTSERGAIINFYSEHCWGMCTPTPENNGSMPDNNGNLLRQEIDVPGSDHISVQWFTYDALNRLHSANEVDYPSNQERWRQTYIYDRWGNRTINQGSTWGTGYPTLNFAVASNTNRLYGPGETEQSHSLINYDPAGNQLKDNYSDSSTGRYYDHAYDAENRMKTSTTIFTDNSTQLSTYSYDGDGRRVKRKIGSVETWQVYGVGGELLAEYAANAPYTTPQKEYGYRNGQLLVEVNVPAGAGGTAPTFTDDPLVPNETDIRLIHLTQLRTEVNNLRARAGLPAATFSQDPTPTQYVTEVHHDHIMQLRAALEPALSALHLPTVPVGGYAHGTIHTGDPIYAIDFQELRNEIKAAWALKIHWLVTDQLGTPRMIFDQSGSLTITESGNYKSGMTRHDYLPFGEELSAGTGGRTTAQGYSASDGARQKFTSKERDLETGLDYSINRYYSSTQGRFTSVDPENAGSHPGEPQSWNGYAYAGNNPLLFVDPDGLDVEITWSGGGRKTFGDDEFEKYAKDLRNQGFIVKNGNIYSPVKDEDGNVVGQTRIGTYSNDCLYCEQFVNEMARQTAPIPKATLLFAVAGVAGGVTGGAAYYVATPFMAPTVTTLALRAVPALPAVVSAIDKLRNLGISVEQANEIVQSPTSQKLIDNANNGNINVIQEVGGKLIRITTDPSGQRIISAGIVRANSITNGIANGRFTPKK